MCIDFLIETYGIPHSFLTSLILYIVCTVHVGRPKIIYSQLWIPRIWLMLEVSGAYTRHTRTQTPLIWYMVAIRLRARKTYSKSPHKRTPEMQISPKSLLFKVKQVKTICSVQLCRVWFCQGEKTQAHLHTFSQTTHRDCLSKRVWDHKIFLHSCTHAQPKSWTTGKVAFISSSRGFPFWQEF